MRGTFVGFPIEYSTAQAPDPKYVQVVEDHTTVGINKLEKRSF